MKSSPVNLNLNQKSTFKFRFKSKLHLQIFKWKVHLQIWYFFTQLLHLLLYQHTLLIGRKKSVTFLRFLKKVLIFYKFFEVLSNILRFKMSHRHLLLCSHVLVNLLLFESVQIKHYPHSVDLIVGLGGETSISTFFFKHETSYFQFHNFA